MYYVTDGVAPQFNNKKSSKSLKFIYLNQSKDFEIDFEWHFHATYHEIMQSSLGNIKKKSNENQPYPRICMAKQNKCLICKNITHRYAL